MSANATGALPQTPGFIALVPISEKEKKRGDTRSPNSPILAPGTALGLLPSRALSSAQAAYIVAHENVSLTKYRRTLQTKFVRGCSIRVA
jgi:hypothetical protein